MMWPDLQMVSQIAIGRILNSLPEGLLIALFAWIMLRFLPRQNSGTRFAVWFVALLAVAALPLIGAATGGHSLLAARPVITLPDPWGLILFLAWVLAACVAMLCLAIGLWRLRGLRRSCITINLEELRPSIRKTVADCSSSRPVTLATSENVIVPAALGFFKPTIVIPGWALRELPAEELSIILLHEFAHLRRWDDWTNLLQKLMRAVFPFHPAVWWIENRLSLEREMACDDLVLAETGNPRGYAQCLIALLEKSFARRGWAMAQAVVHRACQASLRLAQILDVSRPATKHVWKPAVGIVGAFSLVCLMVLPRAPQFLAFERNTSEIHGDVHAATLSRPEFPAAAVVPVGLRTTPSSSVRLPHQPAAQVAEQVIEPRAVQIPRNAPQALATRWSTDTQRGPVEMATMGAKQTLEPEQTLLVVRTMQRVGKNSWVWSVCVWRITWVAQDGIERAPGPNQT